jgi:chorismate mutase
MMNIRAVRGAITIPEDTPPIVLDATQELLEELFKQNQIIPDNLVSIIFTVTPDIKSEFPAAAARLLGLTSTPLMCAQEIHKPGSLPLCIRVMIHFYTNLLKKEIKPVYLKDAVKLRPDLIANTKEKI